MDNNSEFRVNPDLIHLQQIRPLTDSTRIEPSFDFTQALLYNINFEVGSLVTIDDNSVNITIKALLTGTDSEDKPACINGEYSCEFIFMIENLSEFITEVQNGDKILVIHHSLAGALLGICYSTFRGIVFLGTKSTINSGIILPVINPQLLTILKVDFPEKAKE